eukprot:5227860-Amphidinium_carterae.1
MYAENPEPTDFQGGRHASGNMQCVVCEQWGKWSCFAYAHIHNGVWEPAKVHGKNFAKMLSMVKDSQGGEAKPCPEEQFIGGKVQLACYKCWIKATNNMAYQKDDGS